MSLDFTSFRIRCCCWFFHKDQILSKCNHTTKKCSTALTELCTASKTNCKSLRYRCRIPCLKLFHGFILLYWFYQSIIGPVKETISLSKAVKSIGNIEEWLGELEKEMQLSLKRLCESASSECVAQPLRQFVSKNCGQFALLVLKYEWIWPFALCQIIIFIGIANTLDCSMSRGTIESKVQQAHHDGNQ
jgi:hypothetical protein